MIIDQSESPGVFPLFALNYFSLLCIVIPENSFSLVHSGMRMFPCILFRLLFTPTVATVVIFVYFESASVHWTSDTNIPNSMDPLDR